jgi:hypothetical protein
VFVLKPAHSPVLRPGSHVSTEPGAHTLSSPVQNRGRISERSLPRSQGGRLQNTTSALMLGLMAVVSAAFPHFPPVSSEAVRKAEWPCHLRPSLTPVGSSTATHSHPTLTKGEKLDWVPGGVCAPSPGPAPSTPLI